MLKFMKGKSIFSTHQLVSLLHEHDWILSPKLHEVKSVRIMIRTFKGMTFTIILSDTRSTVLQLKEKIQFLTETPGSHFELYIQPTHAHN